MIFVDTSRGKCYGDARHLSFSSTVVDPALDEGHIVSSALREREKERERHSGGKGFSAPRRPSDRGHEISGVGRARDAPQGTRSQRRANALTLGRLCSCAAHMAFGQVAMAQCDAA